MAEACQCRCFLEILQVSAIKEILRKQKEEEERLRREEEERIRKEEEAIAAALEKVAFVPTCSSVLLLI